MRPEGGASHVQTPVVASMPRDMHPEVSIVRRMVLARLVVITAILGLLVPGSALAAPLASRQVPDRPPAGHEDDHSRASKAVFFVADGLRQDIVARYAADGLLPTMGSFLKKGAAATDGGLLTQAPPNTGAGWYSLATGAWPANPAG